MKSFSKFPAWVMHGRIVKACRLASGIRATKNDVMQEIETE